MPDEGIAEESQTQGLSFAVLQGNCPLVFLRYYLMDYPFKNIYGKVVVEKTIEFEFERTRREEHKGPQLEKEGGE